MKPDDRIYCNRCGFFGLRVTHQESSCSHNPILLYTEEDVPDA